MSTRSGRATSSQYANSTPHAKRQNMANAGNRVQDKNTSPEALVQRAEKALGNIPRIREATLKEILALKVATTAPLELAYELLGRLSAVVEEIKRKAERLIPAVPPAGTIHALQTLVANELSKKVLDELKATPVPEGEIKLVIEETIRLMEDAQASFNAELRKDRENAKVKAGPIKDRLEYEREKKHQEWVKEFKAKREEERKLRQEVELHSETKRRKLAEEEQRRHEMSRATEQARKQKLLEIIAKLEEEIEEDYRR